MLRAEQSIPINEDNDRIKKIATELKALIDRLDNNFKQIGDLIFEIAKLLDESKTCPRGHVCRYIKSVILADKIRQGKISPRWIEKCLSSEYKQEYTKSELSSLSKKNLEVQTDSGLVLLAESDEHKNSTNDNMLKSNKPNEMHTNKYESVLDKQLLDSHEMKTDSSCTRCQDSLKKIAELEQALREYAKPETPRVPRNCQSKYIINKQQKFLIDKALDNCNEYCLLTFNESGELVGVTSDHSVEVQ